MNFVVGTDIVNWKLTHSSDHFKKNNFVMTSGEDLLRHTFVKLVYFSISGFIELSIFQGGISTSVKTAGWKSFAANVLQSNSGLVLPGFLGLAQFHLSGHEFLGTFLNTFQL